MTKSAGCFTFRLKISKYLPTRFAFQKEHTVYHMIYHKVFVKGGATFSSRFLNTKWGNEPGLYYKTRIYFLFILK